MVDSHSGCLQVAGSDFLVYVDTFIIAKSHEEYLFEVLYRCGEGRRFGLPFGPIGGTWSGLDELELGHLYHRSDGRESII